MSIDLKETHTRALFEAALFGVNLIGVSVLQAITALATMPQWWGISTMTMEAATSTLRIM